MTSTTTRSSASTEWSSLSAPTLRSTATEAAAILTAAVVVPASSSLSWACTPRDSRLPVSLRMMASVVPLRDSTPTRTVTSTTRADTVPCVLPVS